MKPDDNKNKGNDTKPDKPKDEEHPLDLPKPSNPIRTNSADNKDKEKRDNKNKED